jgi:lipoate-protein ligase A
MQRLALTLATPAENLALDEALLDWAEEDGPEWEFLRLWESAEPMVVVGRSSRVSHEVDVAACRERGIPILRRSSGGAAIVAGPGCLMFAVVLSYALRPELRDIRRAHACVLGRLADALRPLFSPAADVAHAGTSDLVLVEQIGEASPRKFSGNSLRAKRTHLLYHSTLLYDFDVPLIDTCLKMPPRQPDYRHARQHGDFVTNLPITRAALTQAVDAAWPTSGELNDWPKERVADLVAERFSRDDWNLEFGQST